MLPFSPLLSFMPFFISKVSRNFTIRKAVRYRIALPLSVAQSIHTWHPYINSSSHPNIHPTSHPSIHKLTHSSIRPHSSIQTFIHSGYYYSASSSPLLLRSAPDYRIDTVSELTCRSATGTCERGICSRSRCVG